MQRRKSLKVIATFLLVLMLSFSINLPVFAASGIASMTTDRTVVFYVNVTGDRSLTAHVNIYSYGFTSGQMVTVQVQKPNEETCLAGFSAYTIYTDGTMRFNFMNAPAGQYKVTLVPSRAEWFTIGVEILPGYY